MSKEVRDVLDAIEPMVNDLVTVIETLRDLETDEEAHQGDSQAVQKKLDAGTISKASAEKIVSKLKQKSSGLGAQKKENWDELIGTLNAITDHLARIKDQYNVK